MDKDSIKSERRSDNDRRFSQVQVFRKTGLVTFNKIDSNLPNI